MKSFFIIKVCCLLSIVLLLCSCKGLRKACRKQSDKFPDTTSRAACVIDINQPAVEKKLDIPTAELKKNIKEMSYSELKKVKDYYVATNNKDLLIKAVERMIAIGTDQIELKNLRIELADVYFDVQKLEEAGKLYSEYIRLYPGSEHREYAEYKAILCRFYALLSCDRDQTKTQEALTLAQTYLEQPNINKEYIKHVQEIALECQKKLFDSEYNICLFYIKRGNYRSAQHRLEYINQHLLPILPEKKPDLLLLEYELAYQMNNTEQKERITAELLAHYAEHPTTSTLVAQLNKPKKDYVARF